MALDGDGQKPLALWSRGGQSAFVAKKQGARQMRLNFSLLSHMVTPAPRAAAAAAVRAMSSLARGRTRVVRGVVFGEWRGDGRWPCGPGGVRGSSLFCPGGSREGHWWKSTNESQSRTAELQVFFFSRPFPTHAPRRGPPAASARRPIGSPCSHATGREPACCRRRRGVRWPADADRPSLSRPSNSHHTAPHTPPLQEECHSSGGTKYALPASSVRRTRSPTRIPSASRRTPSSKAVDR